MATAKAAGKRKTQKTQQKPFRDKLILNQWLLSLFEVTTVEDIAVALRDDCDEGLDADNVHHFHRALVRQFPGLQELPPAILLEYDLNIVHHTLRLNERRVVHGLEPVKWKYFQYLMLLFTEIYLDRYFSDPDALRRQLNGCVEAWNQTNVEIDQVSKIPLDVPASQSLNKVSLWSATASGKTLVMHANILQFRHYLEKHKRSHELNRVILLTPNEDLSRQHLAELDAAGIDAELFSKNAAGLFSGNAVEIIDINKLKDETGEKTVAVDAFEGNNLVLVDEGHRGASGGGAGTWMRFRNQLCESGFSFEYSATFEQAVKGQKQLADLYSKNVIFDYSYRFFHGDGFGKDYEILNLEDDVQAEHMDEYLTACVLAFFQQQKLFRENEVQLRLFNVERPLWVFVGSSVNAVRTAGKRQVSDVAEVVAFLNRFVSERETFTAHIHAVLNKGLINSAGEDLFAGKFTALLASGQSSTEVFDDVITTLFNAPAGGTLHLENLKGATGEIALRVGDNDPFGVINVGDDSKLLKLCEAIGLDVSERQFSGSLFHSINTHRSSINLLIGSKKFTEGWSSWRVSTMGLLNVGRGEGSQIIQLFGRGVRLKGYQTSLKRSSAMELPFGVGRPLGADELETLNVFGVRADYMAQFREYLREEGVNRTDERHELSLPVIPGLGRKLLTIRLKKSINGVDTSRVDPFKALAPMPTLTKPDAKRDKSLDYLQKNKVVLNWYPKIQALSGKDGSVEPESSLNSTQLSAQHIAFLDVDQLFMDVQQFKAERGWHTLSIPAESIGDLLKDQSWYSLLIPAQELEFTSFEKVRLWQDIARSLLRKYTERYYAFRRKEWEQRHLEYAVLDGSDPNLVGAKDETTDGFYRVLIEESRNDVILKLQELKGIIESGKLRDWEFRGIKAVMFQRHLYQPLLHLDAKAKRSVTVIPTPINAGEHDFVEDLRRFHDTSPALLAGAELYLLRNLSRGRGVGFFEAGNFHPDFILWVLRDSVQHIVFVDPKGVRNIGLQDPKIRFHATIKQIENRLGDDDVFLDSYIVSNTPSHEMEKLWGVDKAEMLSHNIVFQREDKDSYIETLLSGTAASSAV